MATPADIALLRCEADRLASVAVLDGAEIRAPSQATPTLEPAFVSWIANVGAFAITLWELQLLRSLGYSAFNATFDALTEFVDAPTVPTLDAHIQLFAALFSAAATRRGVPSRCGVQLTFPGLEPPDARILPQNLPDDLDVPSQPPRVLRLPFGFKVTLGASLGVLLVLGGAAWVIRRRGERARESKALAPPL